MSDRWLAPIHRNAQARLRLLCFPYTAGRASLYNYLPLVLPDSLLRVAEIWAIEYPGHGERYGERPESSFEALTAGITAAVIPFLDRDTALLGCSLGGMLSFEVARAVRERSGQRLRHLFVAACGAPQIPLNWPCFDEVPDLIGYLRRLGMHPDEREIARRWSWYQTVFGLPATYRYRAGDPLGCPITVYGGAEDPHVGEPALLEWQEQTSARPFIHLRVQGGHLFLKHPQFLGALSAALLHCLRVGQLQPASP